MLKVLITDDQRHVLDALELLFEMRGGLTVVRATSPEQALKVIREDSIGVVVHDMNFTEGTTEGQEGVELFRRIRQLDPQMPVVLITAWAALEVAVDLVKQGADDYIQKPWDDEALLKKVQNLLRSREAQLTAGPEQSQTPFETADLCGLVLESAGMRSVVSLALKVAPSDVPVLITGPNGSGKEKIAEIIQANSRRQGAPFIKVNVGALPDELFAAELFGAEAGAFTGARSQRTGRFEAAGGGTLFLDEMGNLSMESQAKLLRALQSGEYERLGSSHTRKSDVRVIAATNIDMRDAIANARFREDLYYRLAVIEIDVPPLSQRTDDIVPLARVFANRVSEEEGTQGTEVTLSPAFQRALCAHDWPGNVRELHNRMRRALLLADGKALEPEHLGIPQSQSNPPLPRSPISTPSAESSPLEQAERDAIERALAEANYVVSRAAAALGLSRQALYRRMQKLAINVSKGVN